MKQSSSAIRSRYSQTSSFDQDDVAVFESFSNRRDALIQPRGPKKLLKAVLPLGIGLIAFAVCFLPEQDLQTPQDRVVLAAVADYEPEFSDNSDNFSAIDDAAIPDAENLDSIIGTLVHEAVALTPLVEELQQPAGTKRIIHTVSAGESWGSIIRNYGIADSDALALDKALRELGKQEKVPATLAIGQQLEFEIEHAKGLQRVSTDLRAGARAEILRQNNESFVAKLERMATLSERKVLLGVITPEARTFASAASKAGVPYDVVDELVDLFSDRISFRQDVRLGDRFTVIYSENVLADGTSLGFNRIHAAAFDIGGKEYAAVEFVGADGKSRYFDKSGEHIANTFLRYPLKFTRISSYFNKARFHPVLKRHRPHNGVDFAAPTGTPVRSVADGVVLFAGRKGGNGKMVKIQHNSRYATAYLHLSKIAHNLKTGSKVTRGQQIGAVGATGLATGPHLHYSFYDRGRYVDPMSIKLPTASDLQANQRIDKKTLEVVLADLSEYQKLQIVETYLTKQVDKTSPTI